MTDQMDRLRDQIKQEKSRENAKAITVRAWRYAGIVVITVLIAIAFLAQ